MNPMYAAPDRRAAAKTFDSSRPWEATKTAESSAAESKVRREAGSRADAPKSRHHPTAQQPDIRSLKGDVP